MIKLFSSLRTTIALCALLVALSGWGSLAIQRSPEAFASIEQDVLFPWLLREGIRRPAASWWIFAMIVLAALLGLNTVVCAALRLARLARTRRLPLRSLCAHLAHLGFLLVLGAHALGSSLGFRSDGHAAFGGEAFTVSQRGNWSIGVERVSAAFAPEGYPTTIEAGIAVQEGPRVLARGVARVNQPVTVEGVAIYLQDARPTLRGWTLWLPDGRPLFLPVGKPLAVAGGTLLLSDWARTRDGSVAADLAWTPPGGSRVQGWLVPAAGQALPLPGVSLVWGEFAVDTLATLDVRYDPGIFLALLGAALISLSLLPLLWPGRRREAERFPEEHHIDQSPQDLGETVAHDVAGT